MRVPIVILALVATPLFADVAQSQVQARGRSRPLTPVRREAKPSPKNACEMPGQRKGQQRDEWKAKHADKACSPAQTPDSTPTPTPVDSTPTPPPTPTPGQTPPPAPLPDSGGVEVRGTVFVDMDYSGTANRGDTLLTGWTVQLIRQSDGAVVKSTQSATDGSYVFAQIPLGTYTVCVSSPSTYTLYTVFETVSCSSGRLGFQVSSTPLSGDATWPVDFGYYLNQ